MLASLMIRQYSFNFFVHNRAPALRSHNLQPGDYGFSDSG
jgi:hypothetical protein